MVTTNSGQSKTSFSITDLKIEPSNIQRFAESDYFFADSENCQQFRKSTLNRYSAQKDILGSNPSKDAWRKVADQGIGILKRVLTDDSDSHTIEISLSKELQKWRAELFATGRVLPAKGFGLTLLSDACQDLLGFRDFSPAVLTNDCVFGTGLMNLLSGAYDSKVLVSNYIIDSSASYDHGYHRYFSDFEAVIEEALIDPYARTTPGGAYRRDVAREGIKYIREKISLEEENKAKLGNRSACKLTRDEVICLYFCDSSMWGYNAEAIALGADIGGVVAHSTIAQLSHGVVDIGSDIQNSELFNGFLVTADRYIAGNGGEITESLLRRIYDAFASVGTREWTEECFEPVAPARAALHCWQMLNNRHNWLRRVVLGYEKIREVKGSLREADFEEAFDENFHTTGFSRPLKNPCNGETVCDQVKAFIAKSYDDPLLKELWYYIAEAPLEYGSKGIIDDDKEEAIVEGCRIALCRAYSYGLTKEITWIIGHATLHAWQVSYLFEASMFGSLLDSGELKGGVDWYQG